MDPIAVVRVTRHVDDHRLIGRIVAERIWTIDPSFAACRVAVENDRIEIFDVYFFAGLSHRVLFCGLI